MAAEKEYMTFDEKVALSQVVENLPVNEHPYIYRIVLTGDPAALEDCEDDPGWTYVYFHILKPPTLREVEGYIASRDLNTQSEIRENNLADLESEEKVAESTSSPVKLPSNKSPQKSSEEAEKGSIKARLRRSSRKSEAGSSKQD